MSKVRVHNLAISLDGYSAGLEVTVDKPIGDAAELFAYFDGRVIWGVDRIADPIRADHLFTSGWSQGIGVEIMGRRKFGPQSGPWVDAGFAQAWFESASKYDLNRTVLPITLAAMRLGEVGMVFHPAEMYSCYGLAIRRDSPLADTLVVGYADGTIGYGPDLNAYKAGEYAAVVVPKILDYPPLVPTATRTLAESALGLLAKVAG